MQKYNINGNLISAIEYFYHKAESAVQMNGSTGEWYRITDGVRQSCLLLPTLFNISVTRFISDALEEHDVKISVGGRTILNIWFAMALMLLLMKNRN